MNTSTAPHPRPDCYPAYEIYRNAYTHVTGIIVSAPTGQRSDRLTELWRHYSPKEGQGTAAERAYTDGALAAVRERW